MSGFDSTKMQELFCYLLLFRDKPHSRELLAEVLWSNSTQSRKYLRKTLWQLQTALDTDTINHSQEVLFIEPDWIQVNLKANIWLDVAVLEQAFTQVQGLPGQQLDAQSAKILQDVAALYQGDLLEACYADWCLLERERYRHMYLTILDKLMAHCEAHRQYDSGVSYANCVLRCDRARERTHQQLMRFFYLSGSRTEALRQYLRCRQALDEELGVEPTRQTQQLYQQICADDVPLPHSPHAPTLPKNPSLAHILSEIQHAESLLANARRQLQQEIQARQNNR